MVWWKEAIGLIASAVLLASMTFKSTSIKRNILMRVLNVVGSIFFVIYGLLIPAYSTALTNGVAIGIQAYNIVKLIKEMKHVPEER